MQAKTPAAVSKIGLDKRHALWKYWFMHCWRGAPGKLTDMIKEEYVHAQGVRREPGGQCVAG